MLRERRQIALIEPMVIRILDSPATSTPTALSVSANPRGDPSPGEGQEPAAARGRRD